MDAQPFLATLARVLQTHGLEVILIGNSAAALQGAPVTTIDIDFLFRRTPRNLARLKSVAQALEAVILRPYYPVSGLFRLTRDSDGMQVDFMSQIDGVESFEALRARSHILNFSGASLLVAELAAVIESKRAANRPQDRAVLDILEKSLHAATTTEVRAETPGNKHPAKRPAKRK